MIRRDPITVDYSDLSMVKKYAIELAEDGQDRTVILRPGQTYYNIIPTAREDVLLQNALIVFRTGEHK